VSWTAPEIDDSLRLRACADEERWRAAARLAAQRHGLACSEARMFPTGSDVVLDCGRHVFKMTAPRWARELDVEARWLERVAGRLPVATPEPLARGELDGWPYVLASRLAGRPLGEAWPALASDDRSRLARSIGELCAALHGLPVEGEEVAAWAGFLERMRDGARARLARDDLTAEWLDRVEPFLASLEPLSPRPPVLLHTELLDQHLLVEERSGRVELCGLIDFADGRVGHPWYELPAVVEFVFRGERPLLRELLRAYGMSAAALDEGLSRELCGWSLLHRFGDLTRLIAACGEPLPASLSEIARRLYGFD
jgi:hygromycin-B 7''-O-kinase